MGTVRSSSDLRFYVRLLKRQCAIFLMQLCALYNNKTTKITLCSRLRMFVALIRNKASLILTVKTYFTLGYLISLGAC